MPYNKLFINLACSIFTEKYRTSVFLYKPRPTGSVCTKKTSVRYFSVKTSRSVNKKLVITHVYSLYCICRVITHVCSSYCIYRARRARFVQKDRGPIFLCKGRASEVNKKFIIWHLLAFIPLKQTRNA